ncbi:MAG: GNAT family N-acetyltransferase [Lentisphaeria bacterium]|nr:GNAT family N-acetyltransferase [Lentisphaeria bacterium]
MNIDYPSPDQLDGLQKLWQEAFGDDDAFVEQFYTYGFAPDRCRCLTVDGQIAAALYWFDCSYQGKPLAYLYGVATAKTHRGKGLCRILTENTHSHLKYLGYAGEILVPAEDNLFQMYEKMGYSLCSSVSEFTCQAGDMPVSLRSVDAEEYCRLRREFIPENGVLQEGDNLNFLQTLAEFYTGEDFLAAVYRDEKCFVPELLGNRDAAPGILAALHKSKGHFRTPGTQKPFAMYHALSDMPAPEYFGLAFD